MKIKETLDKYIQESKVVTLDTKTLFIKPPMTILIRCQPHNGHWKYKLSLNNHATILSIYIFEGHHVALEEMDFKEEYDIKREYTHLTTWEIGSIITDALYKIEDKFGQPLPEELWNDIEC